MLGGLGVDPTAAVMVGDDVQSDIGGALGAGLAGVLVRTGKYREDAVRASDIHPTAIVDSIVDIPALLRSKQTTAWLKAHPHWRFVFTPNHASWLNQVECLFSILARRVLAHGHFDSPQDLAEQMLAFIETRTATPFQWTYTGKVQGA